MPCVTDKDAEGHCFLCVFLPSELLDHYLLFQRFAVLINRSLEVRKHQIKISEAVTKYIVDKNYLVYSICFRNIHRPTAQNRIIITIPSVLGENMNSALGLNLKKPSMINCELMALVMLCAM